MALIDQRDRSIERRKAARAGKQVCYDCGTSEGGVRLQNGYGNMVCVDCAGSAGRIFTSDVDVYEVVPDEDDD